MARENNVIQQQDRPQKPATCKIPALQIHTTCQQPANRNQRPAQQKPATCPTINQQPANRTINLNRNL